MKWGVRRYQNKDGTLTPAGRKRYGRQPASRSDLVKKLANRDFDVNKKFKKLDADYEKRQAKLESTLKEPDEWWDKDGRITKEASEYMDAFDKAYADYSAKSRRLSDELRKEEADLRKSIFSANDVKSQLVQAKQVHERLNTLYDNTVGFKSKAYQDALKAYLKNNSDLDDAEYGFDHYYWPSSKERKQAMADYERKAREMEKQYTDLVTSVGKTITEGLLDQKMPDNSWYNSYEEWGRNEVDNIIRFNRIQL
jgi:hypothetical protein